MSLLTMVQHIVAEIGLPNITTVIGSTDETARQLKALIEADGRWLRDKYEWDVLNKERTLTFVAEQDQYPLPGDYDQMLSDTLYFRDAFAKGRPVSAQSYQRQYARHSTSGVTNTRLRIRGSGRNNFLIYPKPSTGAADRTAYYEMRSTNWIKPPQWISGKNFSVDSYCFSNGEIYYTAAGGAAGATPPTWLEGTESDGNVDWTFYNSQYSSFITDEDGSIIDEQILEKGGQWRFMRAKGLPDWEDVRGEYFTMVDRQMGKNYIGETISLVGGAGDDFRLLDEWNIPDHLYNF